MARKKIGLAFSGGAARGFAHLGVLRILEAHKIPIDFIAGTSAGSFAGGAAACGMSADEIIVMGRKISWFKMTGFSFSPKGLLSNAPMGNFIKQNFPFRNFEDLPIPFAAVACDLETGEEIILRDTGDLAFAVRASCALPGVFVPLEDDRSRKLIDGGIVAPVPTRAVKKLGAEIVIAVDVISSGATYWGSPSTLLGVFFQSAMMLLRTAAKHQHYRADIVIIPKISHLRPDEIGKMDEFIKAGEEAALEKIDEIKKLIFSEEEILTTDLHR
ncbi:MAG: patatin-like phospholipase family protein [Pyrinomonadaceae bacterium]|nr:patatin-like phospholipase family protein [Acidobacteriota bacterium]